MTSTSSNNGQKDLVDEFEEAFQSCISGLSRWEASPPVDHDEVKTDVESHVSKFLDLARQLDCFLLQKRLMLSAQKPEQILREEITDLKNELTRKDQLLQRHQEKITQWQRLLCLDRRPVQAPQSGMPPQSPGAHRVAMTSQIGMSPGGGGMPQGFRPPGLTMTGQMPGDGGGMPPQMQSGAGGLPPPGATMPSPVQMQQQSQMQLPNQGGLQGPLAYLEKTTSNIGMPDIRR